MSSDEFKNRDDIEIDQNVLAEWHKALSLILFKEQPNSKGQICFAPDYKAEITENGELELHTTINSEPVIMTVPRSRWRYRMSGNKETTWNF